MKGNDGTGNVEERDNWQTPQWLFDKLHTQYNFDIDCCATKENSKCVASSDNFERIGIMTLSVCWMNPPFSKSKKMFKHFFKVVNRGVAIYRCDNLETALWQDTILKNATWILIPKGRISYEGKEGKGSRFPSALIGFNVPVPNGLDGATLIVQEASK